MMPKDRCSHVDYPDDAEQDQVLGATDGDLLDAIGLELILAKLAFDWDQGSLLQALFDRIDLPCASLS